MNVDLRKVELYTLAIEGGILLIMLLLGSRVWCEHWQSRRAAWSRRSTRSAARKFQLEGNLRL